MRDIIFRGKRIDNGEWVYGFYCHYDDTKDKGKDDCDYIVEKHNGNHFPFIKVLPETVGQYTGVTDKNGRKIFEGDILSIKFQPRYVERVSWEGKPDAIAKVFWDFSAFRLRAKNDVDIRFADFCDICSKETEIIANIHDNPELLDK